MMDNKIGIKVIVGIVLSICILTTIIVGFNEQKKSDNDALKDRISTSVFNELQRNTINYPEGATIELPSSIRCSSGTFDATGTISVNDEYSGINIYNISYRATGTYDEATYEVTSCEILSMN